MNQGLAEVTSRIAALTSVRRARKDDETRTENNGGDAGTLNGRQLVLITTLRENLAELEKTLT